MNYGKKLRLNRIVPAGGARTLIVAFDHALPLGPIPGTTEPAQQVRRFAEAGADAVLLNIGGLNAACDALLQQGAPALILRADWVNLWNAEGDPSGLRTRDLRGAIVAQPEEALRLGADAVLTYLILGTGEADFEAAQIVQNARIARECERLGLPLIIESLARGRTVRNPTDPKWLRYHTRVAAELGADAIKTEYSGDVASMRQVVEDCPVPILALGGSREGTDESILNRVSEIAAAGAAGIFFGRNVFQSADVRDFMARARRALNAAQPVAAN